MLPPALRESGGAMRLAAAAAVALIVGAVSVPGSSIAAEYERVAAEEFGAFLVYRDNPRVIVLGGYVGMFAEFDFRAARAAYPEADTLALNSDGGDVSAALVIAGLVHEAGLATIVPQGGRCYSSCAFIYMAGRPRNLEGSLGVHQFTREGPDLGRDLAMVADIIDLTIAADIPPAFLATMLRTPPDGLYVFDDDEIERFNLEVGQVDAAVPEPGRHAAAPGEGGVEAALSQTLLERFAGQGWHREALLGLLGPVGDHVLVPFGDYLRAITNHPNFVAYVIDELPPRVGTEVPADDLMALGFAVGEAVVSRGMARLPPEDQRELINYGADLFRWMIGNRPGDCRMAVVGADNYGTAMDVTAAFLSSQTPAYVGRYFALVQKAALSELDDYPRAVAPVTDVFADADLAYRKAFYDLIQAQPNGQDILAAGQFPSTAAPELICQLGALALEAVDLVEPAVRDEVALMLVLRR
jgi:hypothetical protein